MSAVQCFVTCLALLAATDCADGGQRPSTVPPRNLGSDLAWRPVAIEDFGGEVLLVSFWGAWAIPCRHELTELDSLLAEYGGQVSAVAVNHRESTDSIGRFLDTHPLHLTVTVDEDGTVMSSITSSRGYPATLIFDGGGTLRLETRGYFPGIERERAMIRELVGGHESAERQASL